MAPDATNFPTFNTHRVPLASAADNPAPFWFEGEEARGVGTLEFSASRDHRLSPLDEPRGAAATRATFPYTAEDAPCFAGTLLLKQNEGARHSKHLAIAVNHAAEQTLEELGI